MSTLDYILVTVALILAAVATPYLHRMHIVHTAAKRVDLFFARPCEETYLGVRDYCLKHNIGRGELPPGYYAKLARMEQAIYSLRALGRPANSMDGVIIERMKPKAEWEGRLHGSQTWEDIWPEHDGQMSYGADITYVEIRRKGTDALT